MPTQQTAKKPLATQKKLVNKNYNIKRGVSYVST